MSGKVGFWSLLRAYWAARKAMRRYEKGEHAMSDFQWNPDQSRIKAHERAGRSSIGFGVGGIVVGAIAAVRHLWPELLWPEASDTEIIAAATLLWGAAAHVYTLVMTYFADKAKYQAIEAANAAIEPVELEKL